MRFLVLTARQPSKVMNISYKDKSTYGRGRHRYDATIIQLLILNGFARYSLPGSTCLIGQALEALNLE